MKSNRIFILLTICLLLIFNFTVYLIYNSSRAFKLYTSLKSKNENTPYSQTTNYYHSDLSFSYRTKPLSEGVFTWNRPEERKIPLLFDQYGGRTGTTETNPSNGKKILILGCSFSFGAGVLYENTFAHLIEKGSGLKVFNQAFSGYGLAQMLSLARELIPNLKPDVVLIQISPWLIERAVSFLDITSQPLPGIQRFYPYLSMTKNNNKLKVSPMLQAYDVGSIKKIKPTSFLDFYINHGFGFVFRMHVFKLKKTFNSFFEFYPPSVKDHRAAEIMAYNEIISIIKKNDGTPFLLYLNSAFYSSYDISWAKKLGIPIINTHTSHASLLDSNDKLSYMKKFNFMDGEEFLDGHPNILSHKIIANDILESFKENHIIP